MDQGWEQESPSASSTQNKPPNFIGSDLNYELSQVVHPLPQGCSNEREIGFRFQPTSLQLWGSSQSQQVEDAGPPLLIPPLLVPFGNSLGNSTTINTLHCNSATQACTNALMYGSSIPLRVHGISHGIPDLMNATSVFNHGSGISNVASSYQTYETTSSMASGTLYRAQGHTMSSHKAPFGNLLGNSKTLNALDFNWPTQPHSNAMMHGPSVSVRLHEVSQGIQSPMNATSVFNQGSSSSFFFNGSSNYETTYMASGSSYRRLCPVVPRHKADQGLSSHASPLSRGRFTIYDRRYEEMGVPVDPHLRMFNRTWGNGTARSRKQTDLFLG